MTTKIEQLIAEMYTLIDKFKATPTEFHSAVHSVLEYGDYGEPPTFREREYIDELGRELEHPLVKLGVMQPWYWVVRTMKTLGMEGSDSFGLTKFGLRSRVKRIGEQDVRTVQEIRHNPPDETMYSIQLGSDFATRVWVKESELEQAILEP